jgi:hypothetical protein
MIKDGDVNIEVYSCNDGCNIQVLNADGDRLLFSKDWFYEDYELGSGGEMNMNFVELLKFLGYRVYHEEVC